jgi:membrane associated rhomboid family serine protease
MGSLRALTFSLTQRIKTMRAVGLYSVLAVLISVVYNWFIQASPNSYEFTLKYSLLPLSEESRPYLLPLKLITYGFIHNHTAYLVGQLIGISVYGMILEPRIGSPATGLLILSGIIFPGAVWAIMGYAPILGSTGIAMAMLGSLICLFHLRRDALTKIERILIIIFICNGVLFSIGMVFGGYQMTPWTVFVGLIAGYAITRWIVLRHRPTFLNLEKMT